MFDVAVVGASIAGSVLSKQLAARGYSVALIDKASFPRSKPCGEGLSKLGLETLRELAGGSLDEIPVRPFRGYAIHPMEGAPFVIPTEFAGVGIERSMLDAALLSSALQEPTVTAILGQKVTMVEPLSGAVHLEGQSITARYVVDAAGQGGWLYAHSSNPAIHPLRYGLTFHLQGTRPIETPYANVFLHPAGEFFCTPLASNRLNVSFLGHRDRHRSKLIRSLQDSAIPKLLESLNWSATVEADYLSTPIHKARQNAVVSERCIRVGDACEQFDPIGGMGMTHAILSAQLAARALASSLEHPGSIPMRLQEYSRNRERAARPLRGFTTLTYHSLKSWQGLPMLRTLTRSRFGQGMGACLHGSSAGSSLGRVALAFLGAYV
ncbi:MAG: NAD(P)/FAD-dependent oxidoreductase [Bdellovibrionota bacterium]|nr:MAG: NAD(P)/FAD-dependent oxidoreductase [Bdellovibrionota bacterium]